MGAIVFLASIHLRIKQGIQRIFGILFISLLLVGLFVSRSLSGLPLLCYNLIG